MPDLNTFSGFKNWLIVAGFAVIVSLLGMVAANNRDNIAKNEQRIEKLETKNDDLRSYVIELRSQARESERRLLEIEGQCDALERLDRYRKQR